MYDQLVQLLLVMSTVYGLAYLIFTNARHASRYCYLILTNLSFKYYGGFFFFLSHWDFLPSFFCHLISCQTSTRISHRYMVSTPSRASLHLPPHPTLLDVTEPLFEFPEAFSRFPVALYFTYDIVSFHVTLSINLPPPSSPYNLRSFL